MSSLRQKLLVLNISPVKKERMRKAEKERYQKELRASLPVLTRDEIRRHRLPYHEAIISELDTTGHPSAAEFMRQLIRYQELLRQEHGPDTIVWNRPQLYKSKPQMDALFSGLSKAETFNQHHNVAGECDELTKLAVKFSFGSDDWWWLGEQLMMQCVNISSEYDGDGRKRQALSRYLYGKFFLENAKEPVQAQHHLDLARELSIGMPWNAANVLDTKQDVIFIESCILLYNALMEEAETAMKFDIQKAIKLSVTARKRAAEACYFEGETNALLFKGKCERLTGDTSAAISSLQKALHVQLKHESPKGICEARVQLALAYIRHGDTTLALQQLQALMDYAKEHEIPHYIAQAYRYLGMHYITSGEPAKATPLLIKTLNLFHQQGNIVDMEQVRNFAAISTAQELLPQYTRLILKCVTRGVVDGDKLRQLLRWKDVRDIFWSQDDQSLESKETVSGENAVEEECMYSEMYAETEYIPALTMCDYINEEQSEQSGFGLLSKFSADEKSASAENSSGFGVLVYKDDDTANDERKLSNTVPEKKLSGRKSADE